MISNLLDLFTEFKVFNSLLKNGDDEVMNEDAKKKCNKIKLKKDNYY